MLQNKDIIVKEYSTNDYFGELALFDNSNRKATIIANTECTLATIDKKSFKSLLGNLE